MVAAENKLFMRASVVIFKMLLQVVANGSGILVSDLRKNLSQWQPTRKAFLEEFWEKFTKNNSAQVGQNFQNQLPDNLSGIKTQPPIKLVGSPKSNFCPTWAEVKNHFAAICREVTKVTSTQVV